MIHKYGLYIFFIVAGFFCSAQASLAMDYYWEKHPDHERIIFESRDQFSGFSVKRTGRQELSFVLPDGGWMSESIHSQCDFSNSGLIKHAWIHDKTFFIQTGTDAFGYIYYTLPQENKAVIVMFQDELGVRWEPDPYISPQPFPAPLLDAPQPEPLNEVEPGVMDPGPAPGHKIRATIQRTGPEVR